ncbi:tyrosine-type recombinase/integrase [Microvirga lenta]|uniref:tyrosine-type recombinase/integrase n=1 Tax=Microvirga lenta TaxID=2881337 RepID=UPI001CFFC6A8|nr:site-specific integrase [Microvirga lenta]MCB5176770.1 tyrosine-type recombinase/integrase [Microvirga lenta]
MPAKNLTDVEVRALRANSDQRLEIFDAKARGLCLRVTTAKKAWSFVYRPKGSSKLRRYTIGDYPAWTLSAAREKALALRRQIQDGGDPVVEAKTRRDALTVAGLVERFIDRYAKPKLRSWKDYKAVLDRDVVPALGERPAGEVTRAEVADLLDKVAARAPVLANRLQNTLSSVFSWALSEGLVPANPVTGLRKRTTEVAKERVLSDEEIRKFWEVTGIASPAFRDTLRLILLTGQRPGECAGIRAEEVDLAAGLWTIPASRTKNKIEHTIPLVGTALEIVTQLREERRAGPLILTPRGKELSSQNLAKAMEALRDGVFAETVTPHDLRRTAATLMGRLDIDQMLIGRVLNHASTTKATVTGSVYDRHTYVPQKRRALQALAQEIDRIISGTAFPENVVRIGGGQE